MDYRADIWALSVIAFECLTGRRPFDSEALGGLLLAICTKPLPVPSVYGAVPSDFDQWFFTGCARNAGARFESARAAAAQLRRICGIVDESSGAEPAEPARGAVDAIVSVQPAVSANPPRQSVTAFGSTTPPTGARRLTAALAALGLTGLVVAGVLFALQRTAAAPQQTTPDEATPASAPVAPPSRAMVQPTIAPNISPAPEPARSIARSSTAHAPPASARPAAPRARASKAGRQAQAKAPAEEETAPASAAKPAASQSAPAPAQPAGKINLGI